ncbi:MAG: DUF1576 domain-containing protein [Fibrobacterota bacterium]
MLTGVLILAAAAGILAQGFIPSIEGFIAIQKHPARLINDFVAVGGTGGALLNASSAAFIALLLLKTLRITISGPSVAAFFTVLGFGFFGKTPLNIIPIIFGVYLSSKIAGKHFSEYILIALFGTALGPLVSFLAIEQTAPLPFLPPVLLAFLAGTAAGMLLPAAAMSMLHIHQGYNLYNMGLTCGFAGIFIAGIIEAAGGDLSATSVWFNGHDDLLFWLTPVLSAYIIIFSIITAKKGKGGPKSFSRFFKEALLLQKKSGKLPSDFIEEISASAALFNSAILGLLCWAFVIISGGNFNGPVIGGIFTVIAFGVFGKHLRNSTPVMAGVILACFVFGKELSSSGTILAVLFGTTLAPIAGTFGIKAGILAGFIHFFMVLRTSAWHGGIDLYNNGFSGGLTAALLFAVYEWYRSTKPYRFRENSGKNN